jgi:hypothetical protein
MIIEKEFSDNGLIIRIQIYDNGCGIEYIKLCELRE